MYFIVSKDTLFIGVSFTFAIFAKVCYNVTTKRKRGHPMQETIYVKTCCLQNGNSMKLIEEIKKWLPHASVYVQIHPLRAVVCRGAIATVINEGDVFSLVQRHTNGVLAHDVVNHSEKRDSVRINIGDKDFLIETFIANTVGDTENMKFRLTYLFAPELSRDFDDFASLSNVFIEHLWNDVDKRLL